MLGNLKTKVENVEKSVIYERQCKVCDAIYGRQTFRFVKTYNKHYWAKIRFRRVRGDTC